MAIAWLVKKNTSQSYGSYDKLTLWETTWLLKMVMYSIVFFFSMKNGDFPFSYVNLPEGKDSSPLEWQSFKLRHNMT